MKMTYTESENLVDQQAEEVYEKYGFLRTEKQISSPSLEVRGTATTRYTREWNGYPQTVEITMLVSDVRRATVKLVGKNARKGGAAFAKQEAINSYLRYIDSIDSK